MSGVILNGYLALADLNLWVKSGLDEELSLADIPSLIPNRFTYIVENWTKSIKQNIMYQMDSYQNPDRLKSEIEKFNSIASIYRSDTNKRQPSLANLMDNYFTVFDSMLISDIPVSSLEEKQIQDELKRISSLTKNDFIQIRKKLQDSRDAVADSIGATDSDYNKIYERSPLPTLLNKSVSQIEVSLAFQKGIQTIEDILANQNLLKTQAFLDPFAFARSNTNNPEVDIRSYSSGVLTKLNYGESLRTLAYRTMGDAERWIDIAIANGLKPPYIDEVGEAVFLIANAKGNTLNISRVDQSGRANKEKIYVNQIVILQSNTERNPDQRIITSIKEVPISGELIVELNGESDLSKYKTTDLAHIRVFKPNTINSNFYILIPSTEEVQPKFKEDPWFLKSKAEDEKRAGIDLFIDNDSDLVFSPLGEVSLSYGVDNAIQAIKILMNTFKGSLVSHESYGISTAIGGDNLDTETVKQQISEDIASQVSNDSRFERLDSLSVEYISEKGSANAYRIIMGVVLAGGSTVIPISFSVNIS